MRARLEAIVPAPFRRVARDARDIALLASVPRLDFNTANLAVADDVPLVRLLQDDPSIDESWRVDHPAISALFGDDDLFGGICPGERRALYYVVRRLRPGQVLEIGTHIGASTLYLARALVANGAGHLTTVDVLDVNDPVTGPWRQVGTGMSPRDFAARLGCSGVIDFVAQRSLDFLRRTTTRFDLIFLDGDHRPHTVYREVAHALDVLAPGGILLIHDYYPGGKPLWPHEERAIPGPFRALSRITRTTPGLVVEPFGSLPWITKQGVRATSLACLRRRQWNSPAGAVGKN